MEYGKMLDRLYLSLPEHAKRRERFEMPQLESYVQGSKTYVKNFSQVLKLIHRSEKDISKFITKELATAATISEGRLVLNGRFTQDQVQKMLTNYINTYVLCPECGRPDTKFVEQQGVKMLKCEACGALSAVKG